MAKKTDFDYQAHATALEAVLAKLQDDKIQLDEATKLHAEGMKLVGEIEAYLEQAENTIRKQTAIG